MRNLNGAISEIPTIPSADVMKGRVVQTPPVLVLGFNRVEESKALYSSLARVKPADLFVAIDGPRLGVPEDVERCAKVAEVFSEPEWNCNLRLRIRSVNMGCSPAVVDGISWFFDQVDSGIIFEDDCMPDATFFRYAGELLGRYRNNPQVMTISGDFFLHGKYERPESYYPSRYGHTLGWASWSDSWKLYERDMHRWAAIRDTDWLLGICNHDEAATRYWRKIFDGGIDGRGIEWDAQWLYSTWRANGFALVPTRNLVVHTGVGPLAFHTKRAGWLERLPLEAMEFPLMHPTELFVDQVADRVSEQSVFVVDPTLRQRAAYFSRNPVELGRRLVSVLGLS